MAVIGLGNDMLGYPPKLPGPKAPLLFEKVEMEERQLEQLKQLEQLEIVDTGNLTG